MFLAEFCSELEVKPVGELINVVFLNKVLHKLPSRVGNSL